MNRALTEMTVHATPGQSAGGLLKVATLATLAFSAAEMAASFYARSLALTSDAWHNFSAALALLITWFAFYVQAKAPSQHKTYGYHRAGVLAAFVAALLLLLVAGALFYSGYRRLLAPPEPRAAVLMVMGAAGLVMNVTFSAMLRRSSVSRAKGVGVRPLGLLGQVLGDALASLGILVAAVVISLTGIHAIDPLLAILIAGMIVWSVWDIVTESLNILLEGLPRGMSLEQVVTAIRGVPGVEDVHDLHIWSLGAQTQALSCHIRIADIPLPDGEAILGEVNQVLARQFEIRHTTIQLENAACEAVDGCRIPAASEELSHPRPHVH